MKRILYFTLLILWIFGTIVLKNNELSNFNAIVLPFFVIIGVFVFCRFRIIKNGYGVAIMRAGILKEIKIRWRNHALNDNGDVVESNKNEPKTGIIFVGFWPLDSVYKYKNSWTSVEEDGTLSPHKEEQLNSIILMPKQYYFEVKEAEDGNLMPLNIVGSMWIRVVNPGKALFEIENYLSTAINQMGSAIRDAMTNSTYAELTKNLTNIAQAIMENEQELLRNLLDNYGIEISEIIIKNIEPAREEDKAATLLPVQEEYKKKAAVIEAEAEAAVRNIKAEAEAPAELLERVGSVIAISAYQRNMTVLEYLKSNEIGIAEEVKEIKDFMKELQLKTELAEQGSFFRFEESVNGKEGSVVGENNEVSLISPKVIRQAIVFWNKFHNNNSHSNDSQTKKQQKGGESTAPFSQNSQTPQEENKTDEEIDKL